METEPPYALKATQSLPLESIMPDRERLFRKFALAYRLTDPFSGICPDDCRKCEERESLMLLPYEEEFIRAQFAGQSGRVPADFPQAVVTVGKCRLNVGYAPGDAAPCPMLEQATGFCAIYTSRPFDCRSFPLVPYFRADGGVDFKLARYCPIATRVSEEFIRVTREMWETFLEDLPLGWRRLYNSDSRKHTGAMLPTSKAKVSWVRPPVAR
ncbi:MAG: hypothetical protein Q7T26_09680 [Dehalococcoidia bacterium]|nr:hypothetical protein [Dehalococcoidia bacterium]